LPSTEKSPVSESETPIVIGALLELLPVLLPLPLLVQAATVIAARAVTAVRDKNRAR
jgi:hypothetical protein